MGIREMLEVMKLFKDLQGDTESPTNSTQSYTNCEIPSLSPAYGWFRSFRNFGIVMKLGAMDLNKVPLAMTGVQDTGANDQMAQLGMRMFERFADYVTRDEGPGKGGGNGNGMTMRDMLEFWKLMQGHSESPRARDNGFSDMAKVMAEMMKENFAILREVTTKRDKKASQSAFCAA